jgi:antitoxin component YwqK of YwqJK toxin-antitoxin module
MIRASGSSSHPIPSHINPDYTMPAMRLTFLALLILSITGCDKAKNSNSSTASEEEPIGVQETFSDTPGLIRTEIFDAAGRLTTIGYYLNGKKEGAWTDYTQDERVYRLTTYVGGRKEGIYMEFNTFNQVTQRCFYHNDQRHGKYVEYAPTHIMAERYYSNGKMEGVARTYFPGGKLMEEGYYKDGLREGVSKWYDREGRPTLEYEYHKGELVRK